MLSALRELIDSASASVCASADGAYAPTAIPMAVAMMAALHAAGVAAACVLLRATTIDPRAVTHSSASGKLRNRRLNCSEVPLSLSFREASLRSSRRSTPSASALQQIGLHLPVQSFLGVSESALLRGWRGDPARSSNKVGIE